MVDRVVQAAQDGGQGSTRCTLYTGWYKAYMVVERVVLGAQCAQGSTRSTWWCSVYNVYMVVHRVQGAEGKLLKLQVPQQGFDRVQYKLQREKSTTEKSREKQRKNPATIHVAPRPVSDRMKPECQLAAS